MYGLTDSGCEVGVSGRHGYFRDTCGRKLIIAEVT